MGETRKRKATMAQTTKTDNDTHTTQQPMTNPHATTHTTIRQEKQTMNNPQTQNTKQRPTLTPQKWHWTHAPKTSRLQQPDHTTDRNPWTPTQLPAHIRTITIHLTRKIHKWSECASKGRQQKKMEKTKSLTQINFGPISQWNYLLKWQQKVRAGSQGQTQISKYWPINDQILNLIPVFQSFHSKEKG